MQKIVAIIQARQGSTRLPGKVMMEVQGKPLLGYQLERVKSSTLLNQVIVATTTLPMDDIIADYCAGRQVACYRGCVEDVLKRYRDAAQRYSADVIVRLTADCPLIDPAIIDKVISFYLSDPSLDYASNTLKRTYPRGMDVEVFSFGALKLADELAVRLGDREHVTSYIYHHPQRFKIGSVENAVDYSPYRWTVDTPEDFELINLLISGLYRQNPQFGFKEILEIMEKHPEWARINAHIQQKA